MLGSDSQHCLQRRTGERERKKKRKREREKERKRKTEKGTLSRWTWSGISHLLSLQPSSYQSVNNNNTKMSLFLSGRESIMVVVGVTTGFAMGVVSKIFFSRQPLLPAVSDIDSDDEGNVMMVPAPSSSTEPHKLVLCVRTDLKMQKGKVAAQVGHATLGAYKAASRHNPAALRFWENEAQPKIALQISSLKEATDLQRHAKRLGLVTYMVYDAGRTQIAAVRICTYYPIPSQLSITPIVLTRSATDRPCSFAYAGEYDRPRRGTWSSQPY